MAKIYNFKMDIDEAIDRLFQGDAFYKNTDNGQPAWVNRYNDILLLQKAIYTAYGWNNMEDKND